MFQQVAHKGKESEINYIKRFQNAKSLVNSLGNNYTKYQMMQTFLNNFQQGGNYSAKIASRQ